jgi:thioredoxin
VEIKNSQEFKKKVLESSLPVLVDFSAIWCGPCRVYGPIVEKVTESVKGKFNVYKVDVDENSQVASQYGIRSIPTMVLFKNGSEIARQSGAMMAGDIVRWVQSQL